MPRGRHRHSPPLHRLLPPSALAGVSVVCAAGPWVFSETTVLRALAGAAAVTAVLGAVVMRHWDTQAGKQIADLTRARAGDEWRFEERVAELESDLEESRELRARLEQRLRAKRAELTGLRGEHAALLRRYATAETERASALEGRRRLELEAAVPTPALPAARTAPGAVPETAAPDAGTEAVPGPPGVFSPEGSRLFLRARTALARLAAGGDAEAGRAGDGDGDGDNGGGGGVRATAAPAVPDQRGEQRGARHADRRESAAPERPGPPARPGTPERPGAADGHEHAAGPDRLAQPSAPTRRTTGHFTVPTAVAVAPPAPSARRPMAEGGFDFFGNKKAQPSGADAGAAAPALEAVQNAVQNEDLADVVGQEALALHKAEAEAGFKPAGEESRGVGQVIDLTAHDETEQIDVETLRSAVS
ncbi:hypothetical protein [Streptomyces griseoviridis]|uniref:Secreted protein n=1 Tax=Streptomyces griseoviridis TaxID=45398 RepID=A0ABT9LHU6_STRGD|nr:hypothetical protein [Streptomyces griseoviridis]MDP9683278.1 hypothetical protein [Streptomyces griseoviridis]